ncbi:MAG: adenosylcobinamide-phosphate synthase CbiB [Thermodesulfobacteriota bacterium]
MTALSFWQILLAGVVLDLVLGDPKWLPHPIRWMGKAIQHLEPRFRRLPLSPTLSGGLFTIVLICATWVAAGLLSYSAHAIWPLLGSGMDILLIYYALSIRSLENEAKVVINSLKNGNLEEARKKVGFIVGRDTTQLSEKGVARAVVETVAENFVDGVVSPLFWAFIGGAPLAMAFKMASTLDSMVGYKNETYAQFGKASARLDDLMNYVPARISIPLIAIAAQWLTGRGRPAFITALREGSHHASPNAGYPEAAFAGALSVKLNGPNFYQGRLLEKPYIGKAFGDALPSHARKACELMVIASLLWVGVLAVLSGLKS